MHSKLIVRSVVSATAFIGFFFLIASPLHSGSAGSLRFSLSGYSVTENGRTARITVERINGSVGTVTVQYATGSGTAVDGADYSARSGTLKFSSRQTTQTFSIPILDDSATEGGETVQLLLSNPTGGAQLENPSQAVLTIVDNESSKTTKPNIVFVLTDDHALTDLEFMPALNALLAASGSLFQNGYVTTSLCCPSRSSILTGEYAHNHQVRLNTSLSLKMHLPFRYG
jgi:hypothetical protein